MKKRISIVSLFLVLVFVLTGCSNNFIVKASKNINNYTLDLVYNDQTKTIDGKETVSYINKSNNTIDELFFHLYANNFSENAENKPVSELYETKAYPNGKSYGEISISSVSIGNEVVEFELINNDKDILKVKLLETLYPDCYVNVVIEFTIKLPNVNHRFGYGNNTINLGNFYPIVCVYENGEFKTDPYSPNGDPFYSDLANYNVTITYDKNLILCSTGYVLSEENGDSIKTSKLEAKAVRDFCLVLSDKFKMLKEQVNGTEVLYYYYNDPKPEQSLKTSVLALKTFNNLFGEYPYSTLSIVESNFVHGGMEFPNLVLISDNLDSYEDYTNTIVHEIAHQWWYGLVGNNEFNYGWLDEGLTEYSTALFYENNPEYNIKIEDVMKNALTSYSLFLDVYEDVFGKVDTSMNRGLNEYNTEPEYVYIAYVKGMLLFDSLRNTLTERAFFNSLRAYYENYKGKNATPEDIISVFEKTSHRKLESFFNSFMDGTVVIENLENN